MFRPLDNAPIDDVLESEFQVFNRAHSIDSWREPFLASEYADLLSQNPPRFKQFVWDDEEMFIERFGADVVPLEHGPYQTRTVVIPAIRAQERESALDQLAPSEINHLVAYSVSHDDHEGETGDILLPNKTSLIEQDEDKVWMRIFKEINSIEDTTEFETLVNYFTDIDCVVGEFWKTCERIGYVATGLRAWEILEGDVDLSPVDQALTRDMASDVCSRSLQKVLAVRDRIAYADEFLQFAEPHIWDLSNSLGIRYEDFAKGAGCVE